MKRTPILAFLLLSMTICSCSSENENIAVDKSLKKELACAAMTDSIRTFGLALNEDQEYLDSLYKYKYSRDSRVSFQTSPSFDYRCADNLQPIMASAEEVLSAFDIEDIDQLTSDERTTLALLLYAEYLDKNKNFILRGGNITNNHYVDCLLSALGIKELASIATNGMEHFIKKYGAKQAVKLDGKLAC